MLARDFSLKLVHALLHLDLLLLHLGLLHLHLGELVLHCTNVVLLLLAYLSEPLL